MNPSRVALPDFHNLSGSAGPRRKLADMAQSESEFYEAGMSLPPGVRRDVALRLLESLDSDDCDSAAQTWLETEVVAAYDALEADPTRAIPADSVRAHFTRRWAAHS